jgi:hypothetical protein
MSQKNYCFYSTRCRYSQNFLEALSRSPYSKEFQFVCVDVRPDGTRPSLPPYVKAVPTLMIQGESAPRTDANVMNWLSERRLLGSGPSSGPSHTISRTAAGGAGAASAASEDAGGPQAISTEMFCSGDECFSFLNDAEAPTKQNTMVRIAGNMTPIGMISGMMMPDGPINAHPSVVQQQAAPVSRQSAKAKALDDALEAFQKSRNIGMPGPPMRR